MATMRSATGVVARRRCTSVAASAAGRPPPRGSNAASGGGTGPTVAATYTSPRAAAAAADAPAASARSAATGGATSGAGTAAAAAPSAARGGSATGPAPPPSPSSSAEPTDPNTELLSALAAQFQREALPWIQDLVEPLLMGPPAPLQGTEAPEQLADKDSRFATFNGVRLHYKMRAPGELEGRAPLTPDATTASTSSSSNGSSNRNGSRSNSRDSSSNGRSRSSSGATGGSDNGNGNGWQGGPSSLVLMHGLNSSTFSWRLLMDDLAAYVNPAAGGTTVIAYDRPPYGLSGRPQGGWASEEDNPYTLEGAARLTAGLLTTLLPPPGSPAAAGAGRGSVLVGHSAGSAVAVETALRYPDLVSGLVLISPAINTDSKGFLSRADLGQLLRFAWTRALLSNEATGLNYIRRQLSKRRAEVEAGRLGMYAEEAEVPQEVIDGYLRPMRAHDWDRGTLQAYRAFQLGAPPPPLDRLRVPVLVLHGALDRAVPLEAAQRVAAALQRRGPGCVTELLVLDDCGHVPMDERPLEVVRAVTAFVNRHCC